MLRRRLDAQVSEARPGFILTYQGSEIGIVERVAEQARTGARMLYVRGGISGSLEYAIPTTAIAAVQPSARRAMVDDSVTFEPEDLGFDGRVLLVARPPEAESSSSWRPGRRLPEGCVGFRAYADDGVLGEVEMAVRGTPRATDYLVVRVRGLFRWMYPAIPATYVVEWRPVRRSVLVAGTRREIKQLPERIPPACS